MSDSLPKRTIAQWAQQDRPREKMLLKGIQALSDAELIAILIGSGSTSESAVDLSKRILHDVDNNLYELGRKDVEDLQKFKGIGEVKAITIVASMELARRRNQHEVADRKTIKSSSDVYNYFLSKLTDINHEEFHALYLSRGNKILGSALIAKGGRSAVHVDTKLIFEHALSHKASNIVLVHNHPSGQKRPSKSDELITKRIKEGCDILDFKLIDHIIIADQGFYSFQDSNNMAL